MSWTLTLEGGLFDGLKFEIPSVYMTPGRTFRISRSGVQTFYVETVRDVPALLVTAVPV